MNTIQRALISVSDKSGITEFAQTLHQLGIEILSTGGTAKLLAEKKIPVIEVSDYTGFPEMMDGRVKTLHPKIHGGLLGRRGTDEAVMQKHGIQPIDLLVVNLYPFQETIARPDCTFAEVIENIDIGGPTMLRAAAKNHASVAVVVDPSDYAEIGQELTENNCSLTPARHFTLAKKTFEHTARYDGTIANHLGLLQDGNIEKSFPDTLNLQFDHSQTMRYGENPHQKAAFYKERNTQEASVSIANQLQGKALSFNNVADTDAALECVKAFSEPACVIVKHANPCGVAVADSLLVAYEKAFATDPTSAFGGIIAFNRPVDEVMVEAILSRQFVEVIIAPAFNEAALTKLQNKPNVRVLACGDLPTHSAPRWDFKKVNGGLLVQEQDLGQTNESDLKILTKIGPTDTQIKDLLFAWKVAQFVKSNAIVYANAQQTIGIGAGQMSRVYSAKIASIKAADEGLEVAGSVMASDAFFPFRDGIDAAAKVGIKAVIQPGGSMRDEEVIAAADEHEMAMVFTGMRHFRH